MAYKPENISQPIFDEAIDWLVLMHSGSVDAATQEKFELWLHADSSHPEAFANAQKLWELTTRASIQETQTEPAVSNIHSTQGKFLLSFTAIQSLSFAAILLIGIWIFWNPIAIWTSSDYATKIGEQRLINLSDGSSIYLNTNSAVSLGWDDHQRLIRLLKGQAYFNVVKDETRPFVVETAEASVTALGTEFEVFSHSTNAFAVTVSKHAVSVSLKNPAFNNSMLVDENERLYYSGKGYLESPMPVDLTQINAWPRGKLIFQDKTMVDVAKELNRYSKALIVLKGEDIKQLTISGVFPANSSEVINALKQAFRIKTIQVGPWLTILYE